MDVGIVRPTAGVVTPAVPILGETNGEIIMAADLANSEVDPEAWEPTAEVIQYWRARGFIAHRSAIAGSLILDPMRPPAAPTTEAIQYWRARGFTAHKSAIAGSLILDPLPGKNPQPDLGPALEGAGQDCPIHPSKGNFCREDGTPGSEDLGETVLGTTSGITTGENGEPLMDSDLLGAAG